MTETAVPAIDVRAVTKAFRYSDIRALDGFSMTIAAGEMVAVMGASGSGKTTLLNLIAALDHPTSGVVRVFGVDLAQSPDLARYRSREIGIVFQTFNLFPTFTAIENVIVPMYGTEAPPSRRRARAGELLEYVGLDGRAGQRVSTLSQGQQQRVAIARSLANKPRLLLADEPTGNLDSGSANLVMDHLERINRELGMTILLVTHDARVADRARRIVRIVDGKNAS